MRRTVRASILLAIVLGRPALAPGGFGAGNLVVVRLGDEKAPASRGTATAVFLDEVDPATGAVVSTVPLPAEGMKPGRRFALSFSATSEGQLSTSADGRYLTLAGYDAPLATPRLPGSDSAAVPRVVARVDASGRVDLSTTIVDGYSKNNVRGAVTVDGRSFHVSGAGEGGGVRAVEFGSRGASRPLAAGPANARGVAIFDGRVYASSASGGSGGVVALNDGTADLIAPSPAAPGPAGPAGPEEGSPQPVAPAEPAPPEPKPTGFVFLAGKLYVADLESGLLVYEPEGAGPGGATRYRLAATHAAPKLAWLAGRVVDGRPALFGTDGDRLLEFRLDGPTIATREVARAGLRRAFRGLAFAPTAVDPPWLPMPAAVALGLAGVGLPAAAVYALRRRARRRIRFAGTDILIEGGPIPPARPGVDSP